MYLGERSAIFTELVKSGGQIYFSTRTDGSSCLNLTACTAGLIFRPRTRGPHMLTRNARVRPACVLVFLVASESCFCSQTHEPSYKAEQHTANALGWQFLAATTIVHPIGANDITDMFPAFNWCEHD